MTRVHDDGATWEQQALVAAGVAPAEPAREEWRASLGRALGLFHALYDDGDGIRAVDPRVRRFLDGVRAMVGTPDLRGYRRGPGRRNPDRAAEVATLGNLLEHACAELAKGPRVSRRLDAGCAEALAALAALEGGAP